MNPPVIRVDIAGTDLERMLRFYQEVFGWAPVGPFPRDKPHEKTVATGTRGAVDFRLCHAAERGVSPCVYVANIAECIAKAVACGGRVVAEPAETRYGLKYATISDSEGNSLRLLERNVSLNARVGEHAAKETVVRIPRLSNSILNHIAMIAPQYGHLGHDEESRRFFELEQNISCYLEWESLGPVLRKMPKPSRVLEIGPGLGRSAIFFKKQLDWGEVPFDLYEGEGTGTRYTALGPRMSDSFCGDFAVLERILHFNGVCGWQIIDGNETSLADVPGRYDLVYSFYSVGYHWALEHFLDDILRLLSPRGVVAITAHPTFEPTKALDRLTWRLVRSEATFGTGDAPTMLLLGATPEAAAIIQA